MPRKASGEIKIRIVRQQQKNGDIYILERKTQYDPDKKYNRVISTSLINKIPKGSSEPVPTRPKRSKNFDIFPHTVKRVLMSGIISPPAARTVRSYN